MNIIKVFLIFLSFIYGLHNLSSSEDTFKRLLKFSSCNLSTAQEPSRKAQKNIVNLTDLFNSTQNFDLSLFSANFDELLDSKKTFSCYEKVNLIKLYAAYQYRNQNPENSLALYRSLERFRGLEKSFVIYLSQMISKSNKAIGLVENLPSQESDTDEVILEDYSSKDNRISSLERKLGEIQTILETEQTINVKLLQENKELKEELSMLKESSEDLLIQEFDNLQISRLKKELEVAVDDLEKANERLYLLRVKLEDKDKALEDNYTKLNTLKQKLTEYEPDREDLNKSSVPDFESDNTLILWIILIIALSTGFYFYNEKLKSDTVGGSQNNDKLKNALENLLYQIQPNKNLDNLMDSFIFNYLKGYCEELHDTELESKILFQELVESLSSMDFYDHNKNYITDDSESAMEGRLKGKQDGRILKNNSTPIVLKNYLKKDILQGK